MILKRLAQAKQQKFMAQTFGMGRYVPPDLEGTISHNQASGKGHALGARASKLKTEGILVVRFECPFAIWCTNCDPEQIIGQGVRFNAEKKKVGNYYSTTIWSFRFKHTVCGKWLEVRTDPKNAEYVVVEGGRRRDYGSTNDSLLEDGFRIGSGVTEEEKERLEKEGGFAALEKKVQDMKEHDSQTKRIDELSERSNKDWSDPYEMSRKLRREFRVGRRQRQADEKSAELLKDKFGIEIDVLPLTTLDAERSRLVDFGGAEERHSSLAGMFDEYEPQSQSQSQVLDVTSSRKGFAKDQKTAAMPKVKLKSSLQGNTRAAVDPFLKVEQGWQPRAKRKRPDEDEKLEKEEVVEPLSRAQNFGGLVNYDSDSS